MSCCRTSEPAPYQILVTCLQRNYGLGDTHIHQDMKSVRNGKNEYTMIVNKKEVSVICKNKKDGKQLAAQKLLQQLHPHITSWGSLLRMYGNRSLRKLKLKKEKETEVTGLQTRSSASRSVGIILPFLSQKISVEGAQEALSKSLIMINTLLSCL